MSSPDDITNTTFLLVKLLEKGYSMNHWKTVRKKVFAKHRCSDKCLVDDWVHVGEL